MYSMYEDFMELRLDDVLVVLKLNNSKTCILIKM